MKFVHWVCKEMDQGLALLFGLACHPGHRPRPRKARVITGNDASRIECPLIPRAQPSIDAFCVSASGQFLPQQKKRLYAVGTPVKSFTDMPIGEL